MQRSNIYLALFGIEWNGKGFLMNGALVLIGILVFPFVAVELIRLLRYYPEDRRFVPTILPQSRKLRKALLWALFLLLAFSLVINNGIFLFLWLFVFVWGQSLLWRIEGDDGY